HWVSNQPCQTFNTTRTFIESFTVSQRITRWRPRRFGRVGRDALGMRGSFTAPSLASRFTWQRQSMRIAGKFFNIRQRLFFQFVAVLLQLLPKLLLLLVRRVGRQLFPQLATATNDLALDLAALLEVVLANPLHLLGVGIQF